MCRSHGSSSYVYGVYSKFSAFIRCQDGDPNHPRTKHQVSTNYVFEAFQDCVGAPGGWARNVPRRISCAALPAEARWLG